MPSSRAAIASRALLAIDETGREFEITIRVGEPYAVTGTEWACPASIDGLHGRFADMHGVDSWQALQLALQLVGQMLIYFVEDGGRLFTVEERQPVTPGELMPRLTSRG